MNQYQAPSSSGASEDGQPAGSKRRVLIIVENLPVPFDRRVWRECQALREAGYQVSVIAPRDSEREQPFRELCEGVTIYRYRAFPSKGGFAGYVLEYSVALLQSMRLAAVALYREGFDAIQICNPPDLLILAVAPFKLLGKRIVFDQHDVCPEIYQAQRNSWGKPSAVLWALYRFERLTYRWSDAVLVVNESCRYVALSRGEQAAESVFVVRNGPSICSLPILQPATGQEPAASYVLVYVGMMGPQDGVDTLLRSVEALARDFGRQDFRVVIIGDGTSLDEMKAYARSLGLDELVTFTGRLEHESVLEIIATADVCLCPDPKSPLSDKCSLVKCIEYMSMGKPFVAFDLEEVRRAAGPAAVYAESGTEQEFAQMIHDLLDNPGRRQEMGMLGRARVANALAWEHSKVLLWQAYEYVFQDRAG